MKVHCANCESEGRPALIREKPPFDSDVISHGICERHKREILAWIDARREARDGEKAAAV